MIVHILKDMLSLIKLIFEELLARDKNSRLSTMPCKVSHGHHLRSSCGN